jgi:hypothetical protein
VVVRWGGAAIVVGVAVFIFASAAGGSGGQRDRGHKNVLVPNAYTGRVGFDTYTMGLPQQEGYANLRRLRMGGVTWVREDFQWNYIEPQRGRFVWTYSDRLMTNASRLGINVLAIADYTAGWASGRTDSFKYPPADPRLYAAFVKQLVNRYGHGGTFWRQHRSLPPRPLTALEIWNEPWHHEFWKPEPDPGAYARLVRLTAQAIKSVHPEIKVLASADVFQSRGDTPDSIDWFAPLLKADPTLWRSRLVDAWSVHLYCQKLSPAEATGDQRYRFDRILITKALADRAGASKPIWITEFGWRADQVGEPTQAAYTRDALWRAVTEWEGFVTRSFVFYWSRPPPIDDPYNLVRPDDSTRPAWQAVKDLLAQKG